MSDRRLIEANLPLYEISRLSAKQKQGVRTGQIKALHIWWARRPTAASRAAVLATLLAAPENDTKREELEKFVASACTWDASLDRTVIGKARDIIAEHFNGQAPRVLDPFSGGGIIPLEALRLGCETHAVELNPVAYLINLCTLVYPQKYGSGTRKDLTPEDLLHSASEGSKSRLATDVERWGTWVLEKAHSEIGEFYENPAGDNTTVAYLWARTVKCPNPSCGAEMPLVMQFWLRRRPGKNKVALKPVVDRHKKQVSFEIIRGEEIERTDFDPSEGTTSRGSATCLVCGQTASSDHVKTAGKAGRIDHTPLAVVTTGGYGEGKDYRLFTEADLDNFEGARTRLRELRDSDAEQLPLVPNEPIPTGSSRAIFVHLYGLMEWGQLFNSRQALMLVTFTSKVRDAHQMILAETGDEDYARAVTTYLGLLVDRLADYSSTLCTWDNTTQTARNTFKRQAIPMVWDYPEANVFREPSGPWAGALGRVVDIIDYCAQSSNQAGHVRQGSSTSLPYPDSHFEAVVTDPPYYDAVPYADISDFFYVWLKRSVGELYPQVFRSPLTPKSSEIIQETSRHDDQAGRQAIL